MSWDVWKHSHPAIEIYGSEGSLRVPDPNFFGGEVEITERGGNWQVRDSGSMPLGAPNWRSPNWPPEQAEQSQLPRPRPCRACQRGSERRPPSHQRPPRSARVGNHAQHPGNGGHGTTQSDDNYPRSAGSSGGNRRGGALERIRRQCSLAKHVRVRGKIQLRQYGRAPFSNDQQDRYGTFRTGAEFRFGQKHRTFLSPNEFHYLTRFNLTASPACPLGSVLEALCQSVHDRRPAACPGSLHPGRPCSAPV